MIRINLIPPEYAAAQAKKEQQIIFGSLAGVFAVILLLVWVARKSTASSLEREVNEARAELKKYRAIEAEINRIETSKKVLSAKQNVITDLNKSRLIYPVFFEDFLPIIPPEIWVNNMLFKESGTRLNISMNSNALSNFALATWLTNLKQSQHFSNVKLDPISYTPSKTGSPPSLAFKITVDYQHKGPFPLAGFN